MSFQGKIVEIDRLQQSIEQHGKQGRDLLQKINYKFRLDWNYYSNRMEGNTLTLDETKSVMIGNINVHNKPLKDVMEMKGHDDAVQMILRMGKGELNISEARIRKLHEEIMYEDSPIEKAKIGEWKSQPNHVYNYRDEKFDFIDPSEVKEKMHELVNWVNAENEKIGAKKKGALHPVELAFEFQLRYLTIHPFYDGNGRTGRILTNLILKSYSYPPIYIKDNEKTFYYRYLADIQEYGADKYLLFDLMAGYLIRSLTIVLDAIAGREIEEPEDLDKKIQLLEKELRINQIAENGKTRFSKEVLFQIYDDSLSKLIAATIPVLEKFNIFFSRHEHIVRLGQGMGTIIEGRSISAVIEAFRHRIKITEVGNLPIDFKITAEYGNFSRGGVSPFDCSGTIVVRFFETSYDVWVDDFLETQDRLQIVKKQEHILSRPLTESEISEVSMHLGNTIFKQIDFYTQKSGLRQ